MTQVTTSEGFTVEFLQDAHCEHCGRLTPFQATIRDVERVSWCIDCVTCGDTSTDIPLTRTDRELITYTELEERHDYHVRELQKIKRDQIWIRQERQKSES